MMPLKKMIQMQRMKLKRILYRGKNVGEDDENFERVMKFFHGP